MQLALSSTTLTLTITTFMTLRKIPLSQSHAQTQKAGVAGIYTRTYSRQRILVSILVSIIVASLSSIAAAPATFTHSTYSLFSYFSRTPLSTLSFTTQFSWSFGEDLLELLFRALDEEHDDVTNSMTDKRGPSGRLRNPVSNLFPYSLLALDCFLDSRPETPGWLFFEGLLNCCLWTKVFSLFTRIRCTYREPRLNQWPR